MTAEFPTEQNPIRPGQNPSVVPDSCEQNPSADASNPSERCVQNPKRPCSPARLAANRRNAQHAGRHRKPMDWTVFRRQREQGASLKACAVELGMSYWTLKRRIVVRGDEDSPIW